MSNNFRFKKFEIRQERSAMKVNTDGVLLGAWAKISGDNSVLDIGSGNGLIALMVAQRNTNAKVVAVEIDEGSYQDAVDNISRSDYGDKVEAIHQSIQDFTKTTNYTFDHVISNPPFFSGGTFSTNENKANVRHTIKLPHGDLLNTVTRLLNKGGRFSVILPEIEGLRFIELAERSQLLLSRKCIVYSKKENNPERLLLTFTNAESVNLEESSLWIHNIHVDDFTNEYKALTKDFYLKF